jgi:prepilin-type N-terminal cleavage/methylation domain-containing protein
MNRKISGFTLIEIMITLIVMVSIMGLGIFTLSSYLPKQRLLNAMETTEQALSRAQLEASQRSAWSCITYDTATTTITIRIDTNADRNCVDPDQLITTMQLHPDITYANCPPNGGQDSFDFTSNAAVWFDSAGVPRVCASGNCTPQSLQFIVTNPNLSDNNRAREIEALSSGLISIIDRNQTGFMQGIFARSADLPTGCN